MGSYVIRTIVLRSILQYMTLDLSHRKFAVDNNRKLTLTSVSGSIYVNTCT